MTLYAKEMKIHKTNTEIANFCNIYIVCYECKEQDIFFISPSLFSDWRSVGLVI